MSTRLGGTKSASLNDISQPIIAFCEIRSISLHAVYLPGSMNHEADFQSRARMDASDWMLDPAVFSRISCHWILKIDLFASAWNRELAPPAVGQGDRHFQYGLAASAGLRLPAFCPDPALPGKNQEGSSRANVGGAVLANAALVPITAGTSMRNAAGNSSDRGPSSRPDRDSTPPPGGRRPTANRLAVVRSNYEARRIPNRVIKYLLAADRASTSATYQSAWNAWIDWCVRRNQDSLSPSLNVVLDFLCNLADQGKAYRSVNVYRSMLSVTVEKIEGFDVGKHPLVG